MQIEFFIPGQPKGEPRHQARAVYSKLKKAWVAFIFPSHEADDWKKIVALSAKRHRPATPFSGPVRVDLELVFPRPKRLIEGRPETERIPYTPKPDRDNCDKLVLDQLTKLGFWGDDAQVYDGRITKWYQALRGDPAGVRVIIEAEAQPFFE